MNNTKIILEINLPECRLKIEEDNLQQDIFEFLRIYFDFLEEKRDILSIERLPPLQVFTKPETIDEIQGPEVEPDVEPDLEGPTESNDRVNLVAGDLRLPPDKVARIYDFGSPLAIPPTNIEIEGNSLSDKQRKGLLLILYVNSVLNNEDKMSSIQLKPFLAKSNVSPKNLFNALPPGGNNEIKKDEKTYRITLDGKMAAKELLKKICETLE